MGKTNIEWCDASWNPTRGCTRVSPGCVNCYAETLAARYSAYGKKPDSPFATFVGKVNGHAAWTGKVKLVEDALEAPLRWRKPRGIFVNSMSDLFHEALPDEAIDRVFAVMALCPQHTFQILTKRPKRMLDWALARGGEFAEEDMTGEAVRDCLIEGETQALYARLHPKEPDPSLWLAIHQPLPNVWLGVSVEDQQRADERIPLLLQTPAARRFVSYEPALGPVNFTPWLYADKRMKHKSLDWIIVGGESGPGARPFDIQWARDTIAQCKAAGVACFVKQLGALPFNSKGSYEPKGITSKKGGEMIEWPPDLRVREYPA